MVRRVQRWDVGRRRGVDVWSMSDVDTFGGGVTLGLEQGWEGGEGGRDSEWDIEGG